MSGQQDFVSFFINGKKHTVRPGEGQNSHPKSVLLDYIRHEAGLTGTKYSCREGGCGACVCVVKSKNPVNGQKITRAVNSCLLPVFSCDGYDISTIERLGNHKDGYDIIQNRLVGFSGTQCGFCTPGMVMSMYGLMKNSLDLSSKEIEDNLDGNICRCTGFRPILDAFKSLANDVPDSIKERCKEVEEASGKLCPLKEGCCKAGKCLKGVCGSHKNPDIEDCFRNSRVSFKLTSTGQQWTKPTQLDEVLDLVRKYGSQNIKYRLVAGNTSAGVFKNEGNVAAYIDINGISELREHTVTQANVVFGGGVTLSAGIVLLNKASELNGYEYCSALAKHWSRVANVPVRNAGTIAGNLMLKHRHNEFPSDIFLTLEAIGAKLTIVSAGGTQKPYTVAEFLKLDMLERIIISVHFPSLPKTSGYTFRSFKITKRYQNSHAYVNGALLIKVSKNTVAEKPRICFGGISPSFIHAVNTETFLIGKPIDDIKTLEGAIDILDKEVDPNFRPPDACPEYRKALARNLLYKTFLGINGSTVSPKHSSGAADIEHKVTSGKQVYDFRKDEWPVTQPVAKVEASHQCSGEAEYVNDIQPQRGELFGAFVLSSLGNAKLQSIDASEALAHPDVVAFVSAKDIPGVNNYMVLRERNEEIFVKEEVQYAGQSLGLVLAKTRDAAFESVQKVKVQYTGIQKPILTIKDALTAAKKEENYDKLFELPAKGNPAAAEKSKNNISGQINHGTQFHFQMEQHTTLCIPKEGGMDVFSATQWIDHVQSAIAAALGVQASSINVQVRRLGGAYGSKLTRSTLVAAAAAIGAHVTNKPVRIVLDIETNMKMLGKRPPYWCSYEVGFDDTGRIQNLKAKIVSDTGANANETEVDAVTFFHNVYDTTGWEVVGANIQTNTPSNTFVRAPGTTNVIALIESIMEHIAHFLRKDPLEVRLNNLISEGGIILGFPPNIPNTEFHGENMIPSLVEEMKRSAKYDERKKSVAAFNKENRWMKRGLSIVPMKYFQEYFSIAYPCFVSIYHTDGSVAISHGGIEVGQGINTKAAQVVAYTLNIPLDKIKVKASCSLVSANSICTGAAITSELVCHVNSTNYRSAIEACKILKARMAPYKEKLEKEGSGEVSWEKLVEECHEGDVDLRATHRPASRAADGLKPYNIWGLNLTEVEVDMLTGEFKIVRVDIIGDAGKSISPEIDIGQVEGALVMGLGLWTLEKVQYDEETGQSLTTNTWEYKVPFAKDIPEDFRVTLLTNAPNPDGVLGSKSTGEPPLCMSIGVVFALKHAIDSARQDVGNFDHYNIDTPLTPEEILRHALTSKEHLKF